jgi:hypothetical protein
MPDPVSNDELNWLVWRDLRDRDGNPAKSSGCCPQQCRHLTPLAAGRPSTW